MHTSAHPIDGWVILWIALEWEGRKEGPLPGALRARASLGGARPLGHPCPELGSLSEDPASTWAQCGTREGSRVGAAAGTMVEMVGSPGLPRWEWGYAGEAGGP